MKIQFIIITFLLMIGTATAAPYECNDLGYYIGINAGAGIYKECIPKACFDINNKLVPFGAIKIGYRFQNCFHVEGELAHRYYQKEKKKYLPGLVEGKNGLEVKSLRNEITKSFNDLSLMVNGYYDLNLRIFNRSWYPFVGVGIGAYSTYGQVFRQIYNGCSFVDDHTDKWKNNWKFRYQAMAGISTRICDNLYGTIEWRVYNPHNTHVISFGLMHSL